MATSEAAAQPTATDRQDLIDALVRTSFATMAVLNKVGAEHDLSLWLLRVQALRPAWGDPATHRRRVLEALT